MNKIFSKELYELAPAMAKDIRQIIANLEGGLRNKLINENKIINEFEFYEKTASVSEKFSKAVSLLSEVADIIDNAAKADKQQAIDRGIMELGLLCNKRIIELTQAIPFHRKKRGEDAERWRIASGELAKKGFTDAQIKKILEDTPKPLGEQDHWLAVIKPMEEELKKLTAFLMDKPRYDQSLLIGTQFEDWQPEPTEASIDQAAMMRVCRGRGTHADA